MGRGPAVEKHWCSRLFLNFLLSLQINYRAATYYAGINSVINNSHSTADCIS